MSYDPNRQYEVVRYRDELLPDQSVRRIYSNGVTEWRRRLPDGTVAWQDSRGQHGTDELLGEGIVKRVANGRVFYGKEQGYGRTAWMIDGRPTVTVNETSFGGRLGEMLTMVGLTGMMGAIVWPPLMLSPEEEQQLRAAAQQQSSIGSVGSDTGSTSSTSTWSSDSGDGGNADSDFG
ncbi:hypothetical protein [Chloroflexus aggregans]|uniref:Uncharacterized protein n=1 Tax=Chloroflexus aggregans (strain MD-66 / DSM 9485) TaxID=326427 RepID=B8G8Z6_CHLAD|nr:hypothetical protein [Chloroflexus aggregans]ACL26271.1 conserved hypothetical protein [Chloroflexus aggregans DSM 9485]